MDILGLFDAFFSSFSTHLKMKATEEPSVNDKINDVLNKRSTQYKANTPQNEIDNTKKGIKVKTGQILNYPLPYKEEIAKRKLELENSRKQNKIEKDHSKNY